MKSMKGLLIYASTVLSLFIIGAVPDVIHAENKQNGSLTNEIPIVDPLNPKIEVIPVEDEPNRIPYTVKKSPTNTTTSDTTNENNKLVKDENRKKTNPKVITVSKQNGKIFLTEDFFKKQTVLEKSPDFSSGNNDDEENTYYGDLAAGLSGVAIYGKVK